MLRLLPCLLLLVLCARPQMVQAVEVIAPSGVERVVRVVSPEFRRIEKRLAEIEGELAKLPTVRREAWGSRHGHCSAKLATPTTRDWVVLDLRESYRIDTLALVPANLSLIGTEGAGHGFPKRFRIELADNPEMKNATVLVDHSDKDVINPGLIPMVMQVTPAEGRYLRFTCLKAAELNGEHFWALEELIALEGNRNVARSSQFSVSSSLDLFPLWAPVRLIDGQHGLGMPVDVTQASPSLGYLSASTSFKPALDGVLSEDEQGWCMIDLGEALPIEQLRVLPIESDRYMVYGGRGFPRTFEVELSVDPEFKEVLWSKGHPIVPLGYPAGCAITYQVPNVKARYARIVAKRLWSRDDQQAFGLAEFQIYSGDRNIALGKPVTVRDQTKDSAWAPAHLVDGYTSRYKLIEWPEHLANLARRGELERATAALLAQRSDKLLLGKRLIIALGFALSVVLVAAWVWVLAWQRRARRLAITELRQQISRDLHDDIGSNLGGIVLLSEIGSEHSRDESSRQDFGTIKEAAQQASYSMRDIVWLLQREEVGLKDMVRRMRETADMILRGVDVTFSVEPTSFKDRKLSLFFRRHVFFAFKEAINNVRKHASAKRVDILIEIQPDRLKFRVCDDGAGFDPGREIREGHGLGNLQRRAGRLEGKVVINSKSGSGCEVIFVADYQK